MLKTQGNPGRMDVTLTLLQPVKAKDSIGAINTTYTNVGSIRAEEIFKNSTERIEANQQVGTDLREFRIRDVRTLYPITKEWKFTSNRDGLTYTVRGIENVGRRQYLILTGEVKDN